MNLQTIIRHPYRAVERTVTQGEHTNHFSYEGDQMQPDYIPFTEIGIDNDGELTHKDFFRGQFTSSIDGFELTLHLDNGIVDYLKFEYEN